MPKEKSSLSFFENLRQQAEIYDTSRVTKDDFEALSNQVLDLFEAIKALNEKQVSQITEYVRSSIEAISQRAESTSSESSSRVQQSLDKALSDMRFQHEAMLAEVDSKMKAVEQKIAEVRDGEDGVDADEERVIEEAVKRLALSPEAIKKAVIQAGLSMNEIQGAEDFKRSVQTKTYGPSKNYKFMDDETPAGTIDGANADFTLTKYPVDGSLKLYRGGARQRLTEDYTLAGRTITFIIPPVTGEILLADYRYF